LLEGGAFHPNVGFRNCARAGSIKISRALSIFAAVHLTAESLPPRRLIERTAPPGAIPGSRTSFQKVATCLCGKSLQYSASLGSIRATCQFLFGP